MVSTYIQAISFYFPESKLTNEEISSKHPEWGAEKIAKKTGINVRYISKPDETAVDMAEKAARKLFYENNIECKTIDYLILCTQSPDYLLPTSACILQSRLSLNNTCGAVDINLGCSGYVYGISLAKGLIESGQAKNVLFITSETYSKYLHPKDKSCLTLFGDAASATLLSSEYLSGRMNAKVLNPTYRTVGEHYESLIIRNGMSRNPLKDGVDIVNVNGDFVRNDNFLYMDGKDIFEFSSYEVPDIVRENIQKNDVTENDVDMFLFHQANQYMLNFVRMRCKIPIEKFVIDIADGGNTVSSTIPIALARQWDAGLIKSGMLVSLCGFGVGLSVGAVMLKFT